jgi:mannose-6-phosphate isomerase-like protein (cupin superfamily)
MTEQPSTSTRRVVTGLNVFGKSEVLFDDGVTATSRLTFLPTILVADMWVSVSAEKDLSSPRVTLPGIEPSELESGGHILRLLTIEPDPEGCDVRLGFHTTETVDYVVILDGEIVCLLDSSQVTLHQGDVLVQRGTPHAWSNQSKRPCRLLAVLMDGSSSEPTAALEIEDE